MIGFLKTDKTTILFEKVAIHVVFTDRKCIESTAIMSDNKEYRYRLTRIWDSSKEVVAIIMLNPSKANSLKTDDTIMNITNYLIDNKYGGIDIVNLYAYMATKPADLRNRLEEQEVINNEYIRKVVEENNIMIIAWGPERKRITRKIEVENILRPYSDKLKCFCDSTGKKPRHPLHLSDDWKLINYEFMFIQ